MASLERLGLLRTSLVDYPGRVAAVIFTAGCNLACPYCHNPTLVPGGFADDFVARDAVERFLRARSGTHGGVCITGGEPLLHTDLPQLADLVRKLGMRVKLDTNGMLPERISAVRADAVALDLKLAPERYAELGGPADAAARILRSVDTVRSSGAIAEYRTTVVPGLVAETDIRRIVSLLLPGERYTLTAFRPGRTLDPAFAGVERPGPTLLAHYARIAREHGLEVGIRG